MVRSLCRLYTKMLLNFDLGNVVVSVARLYVFESDWKLCTKVRGWKLLI
jgi:hypothetical protein